MTRELTGNAPLFLDDPEAGWLVTAGEAQVFAVDEHSTRRPLFAVRAGGALFGAPPGLRLIAVGIDGGTAARPLEPGEAEGLRGAWNEALAQAEATQPVAAAERLETRASHERVLREQAYTSLGAVLGGRRAAARARGGEPLVETFRLAAAQLGIRLGALPAPVGDDPVDSVARAAGLRVRKVLLDEGWWRRSSGPLVVFTADGGRPLAMLPARPGRYIAVDPTDGSRRPVDAKFAATLEPNGTMLYRPLPNGPVSGAQVRQFVLRPLRADLRRLVVFGVAVGLLSLVPPLVAEEIFSNAVPQLEVGNLVWLAVLLGVLAVASAGFIFSQQIAILRMEGRATADLQGALWDRLLDLPLPFFRDFSAGNLTMRVLGIAQIRVLATAAVATAALVIPVAVANLILAFILEPRLALFGVVIILGAIAAMVALCRYEIRHQRQVQRETQEEFATAMQLVQAVSKLRVADAQGRAFARWAERLGALKHAFYESQLAFVWQSAFTASYSALAIVLIVLGAATLPTGSISGSTFIAFNTAFIEALIGIVALGTVASFLAAAIPLYENTRPILAAERETTEQRRDPGELRGAVGMSHVTFRYGEDGPTVLDDVSFSVAPGEFLAVVGPSGAGKSSLMRVLLGFERPEVGTVDYDGESLDALDVHALRRQMGVVVQTARLLPGNVFRNIVGARPLTMEDAWAAAEIAGIANDIRALPMGMQTFVAEGAATFSGGQRQRLLIARGVAGRPRILLFDEATSALDNRTQAEVADAIAALKSTRVVIAHRLSTVQRCDRVLVMERGRVVQEGTFDALLEVDGPFRRLAHRQLV